jgi:hypothetical protein
MKMRDALFFFGPVLAVMAGLSTFIVAACLVEPDVPSIKGGPSDSGMVCILYFPLHLLLWIPVGAFTLLFYHFRYRGSQLDDDNDRLRAVLGYSAGGMLIVGAMAVSGNYLIVLAALFISLVLNIVPAVIVVGVGTLITWRNRKRLAITACTAYREANPFHPSLR